MYFKNYQGIKDKLTLDFDVNQKAPHCIIGNNKPGKTTILKEIELIGWLYEGTVIENGKRKAIKNKVAKPKSFEYFLKKCLSHFCVSLL